MSYRDLRDFIAGLERDGQLKRIAVEVDPKLEMTEICDRVLKQGGPALLFEKPKGYSMPVLGNLFGTPHRVAKMYIKEIFSGLNPDNKPSIKLFENKYQYKEMLVERNITFYSNCEHHFVPIIGKAHVAYISNGKVIGLSKLNRIVQFFAKRPQVQERLTIQIAEELKRVMETEDVAVLIDAVHLCVSSRGVQDFNSATVTSSYSGAFNNEATRNEFLKYVNLDK